MTIAVDLGRKATKQTNILEQEKNPNHCVIDHVTYLKMVFETIVSF